MRRPTLALCIPAHNASSHLPQLLRSAQSQSPAFSEIIICDDASTDDTAEVAQSFGARLVAHPTNRGCSFAKNTAWRASFSDWIHFHDADDVLLDNFTAEASGWLQAADAVDVVVMGFEYRDAESNDLLARGIVDDEELRSDPIRFTIRNKVPNFGLYKRSALERVDGFDLDPEVLYNEDVAFHTKLALAGLRFRASNTITSINWRHRGSMSASNQVRCLKAHHAVMRKTSAAVGTRYPKEIASRLWAVATGLAAAGDWDGVSQALSDAAALDNGVPSGQSLDFAFLCCLLGPKRAFRVRENLIQTFKPSLRSNTNAA